MTFARSLAAASVILAAGGALAQPGARRITTVDALRQYPGYFHLQAVLLRGELAEAGGRVMLRSEAHELRVLLGGAGQPEGTVDVRGQMLDVGRLRPGDPRLADYTLLDEDRWPAPGEELLVRAASVGPAPPGSSASLRTLALEPWTFVGRRVTVVGQFRGRNLFGDLPDSPRTSRYDFVLKAADGAVWVTGERPRGRGFDLDVDRRVDTGQWLEVAGIVAYERGLVRIEAAQIEAAEEPTLAPEPEQVPVVLPPQPPVEVVFSSPTQGETDVSTGTSIRIQFSRSIEPDTLDGRIRVSYLGAESLEKGEAQPPGIEMNTSYDPGTRALELTFASPLERFRTVRVQLLEGIEAFDGAPVVPWTLTFSVGG